MITQRITIKPSVLIATAVSLVHLVAGGILWVVPFSILGKFIVAFLIAFSLLFFMSRDAGLHSANSFIALELRDSGEIAAQTLNGKWLDCEILGSSFVSPQMTVVILRPRGRMLARRLILVSDNVNPGDFRRLRIWLRWRSGEDASVVPPLGPA